MTAPAPQDTLGKGTLLKYARRNYPEITDENELLSKALEDFKLDASRVRFVVRGFEDRPELRRKWRMSYGTAHNIIKTIPREEQERLMEQASAEVDESTKKEILEYQNRIEARKLMLVTSFVKFEQLSEVKQMKQHISDESRHWQRQMVAGMRMVCLKFSEFYGKVFLPIDLLDPQRSADLWNEFMTSTELDKKGIPKGLTPRTQLEAKQYQKRRTGSEVGWERVWETTFRPSTKQYRDPIRLLQRSHGLVPIVTGEKDIKKTRILRLREADSEEEIAEEIVESITKSQFVEFCMKVIELFERLKALEYIALACFLVGTATRIGSKRYSGALSIKLGQIDWLKTPVPFVIRDKVTKSKPDGIWEKFMHSFTVRALKRYLKDRFRLPDDSDETMQKLSKQHTDEDLFPSSYEEYRKAFRKGYDAIGLTTIRSPMHSLRHSWVDWTASSPLGKNLLAMANLGGWDDPSTMATIYFGSQEAILVDWHLESEGRQVKDPEPFEKGLEELEVLLEEE